MPNGYGGIRKLSGNRRRPYQVVVTAGWEQVNGKAKQVQKTIGYYPTKAEALNALAEFNVNPIDVDKTKTTFKEVWKRFSETQEEKSASKQRALQAVFKKSAKLHDMPLAKVKLTDLQAVIDGLSSHSYKAQFIVSYRGFYDFAVRRGYAKQDIALLLQNTSAVPKPKVNAFTQEEVKAMPRHYDLFFYTGMRVGEMLDIKYEDIDFEREVIHCKGTKTKAASRFIPIHPEIREYVFALKPGEYLWKYERAYTPLLRAFTRIAPNHKPHDMRKTFATMCYLSGVDDVITKRLMGHTVSDITHSTYIKNDDVELLRNAINKISVTYL